MFVYWLLFLIPVVALLHPVKFSPELRKISWIFIAIVFLITIGLRHHVGVDWNKFIIELNQAISFDYVLDRGLKVGGSDPGFIFINWIVNYIGGNIYLLNLLSASFFVHGVWRFSSIQPYPWLVLVIAVPYLIIIVSMGYTRQAIAIGFIFSALAHLQNRKRRFFWVYLLLAVLFHKTAIIMSIFGLFYGGIKNTKKIYIVLFVLVISLFTFLLLQNIAFLYLHYVELNYMHSSGALPRTAINVIAALTFLFYYKKLNVNVNVNVDLFYVYRLISIAVIVSAPLVFISSTAVDRLGLYFFPLQLYVIGRIPLIYSSSLGVTVSSVAIVIFYALVLLVWMVFATHTYGWIPYDSILIR